jgi:hypothetical protein
MSPVIREICVHYFLDRSAASVSVAAAIIDAADETGHNLIRRLLHYRLSPEGRV